MLAASQAGVNMAAGYNISVVVVAAAAAARSSGALPAFCSAREELSRCSFLD